MGSGISSLARLRKAVLIRAYNLRASDQTLIDQFMPFTYQKDGKGLHISIHQIKKCLKMDSPEYKWVEEVLQAVFTVPTTPPTQKSSELYFYDFIQFLETGKAPNTFSEEVHKPPDGRKKSMTPGSASNSPSRQKRFPPMPPSQADPGNNHQQREAKDALGSQSDENPDESKRGDDVIEINLSRVDPSALPESVKLHDSDKKNIVSNMKPEETLEIIVRPAAGGKLPLGMKTNGKALWRKREVVKQERSVHYTTIDDDGGLQELVEKETTQTEVLHMECRETGEFAHRELTEFEQVETFNDELVNAVRGNEEYVHLKSLEDEFHYMESNMPPKEEKENNIDGREEYHRVESPQREGRGEERGDRDRERDAPDPTDPMAEPKEGDHRDEYGHYAPTDEQEEPLAPPNVSPPPSRYQVPDGGYSPLSQKYEHQQQQRAASFDMNMEEHNNHPSADAVDVLGLDNTQMSRQQSDDDEILLQEPGSVRDNDPLNATARLGSTHSSYQSLHEID